MLPLQTIIVDDEPDSGRLLKALLSSYTTIEILHVFTDANQALDCIIVKKPPLVFVDIEMPDLDGLEMLQQINLFSPDTKVIFVTAYQKYALEAIQNSAFDFICKPIDKNELQRVVRKTLAHYSRTHENETRDIQKSILLKTTEGHHFLTPKNILFLEADGNYTSVQLNDGRKLLSSINLGKIQEQFLPDQFIRISRKHVINKIYLSFVNFGKKYCLISTNGEEYKLEISSKMKDLKQELG